METLVESHRAGGPYSWTYVIASTLGRYAFALVVVVGCWAQSDPRDVDPAQNLALNKSVTFLPAPDYFYTAAGGADATDLTDGKATTSSHLCGAPNTVEWLYPGRVNLAVDLGAVQPIDEVAMRFQGGSLTWPSGWVEAMVSDGPGQPYYKVAELSRWRPGDYQKYEVPTIGGTDWAYRLRFQNLKTRGRFVGIRFYGTAFTCSDQIYVFKGSQDPKAVVHPQAAITDFTVTDAQMYFHKPVVYVTSNIVTPLSIGSVAAPSPVAKPMSVSLTLPKGVTIAGGAVAGNPLSSAVIARARQTVQYIWNFNTKGVADKVFARLYVSGSPDRGAKSELSYKLSWASYESPVITVPMQFIDVPQPRAIPQRLMLGLSWWSITDTQTWPDWDRTFRNLGFNTISAVNPSPSDPTIADFVAQARAAGYRMQLIDSTFEQMASRRANQAEIYCQFADGTHSQTLCPSYRGQYYQEEMDRVAAAVARLQPSYLHTDIEIWGGSTSLNVQKCTRCQADKKASGIAAWPDWFTTKGEDIWIDLYHAAQGAAAVPLEMGSYDFRPGETYQLFWPVDRLYPAYLQSTQVSTYTPFEPYHIELTGDNVQADRKLLPKTDELPWISPGDAGTFPGDALYYALLECFVNGSRGVNFWSGRVWDGEYLAAYARAIRAVQPVEDIIVDGDLFLPEVDGKGRVSGMRRGEDIVLLVADYYGTAGGAVNVKLNFLQSMQILDLDQNKEIGISVSGPRTLRVDLGSDSAKLLLLTPRFHRHRSH